MATVKSGAYQARVRAVGRELKRLYRDAGEPPLRDLERFMEYYSRSTISRYLNGGSLPRGRFFRAFLEVLEVDDKDSAKYLGLMQLRNAAREVLDPLGDPDDEPELDPDVDIGIVWAEEQFSNRGQLA